MSETQPGPDWWKASDNRWYPPASAGSQPVAPGDLHAHEKRRKQAEALERHQAKLASAARQYLVPGEQLQAVFLSQTGPSPRGGLSIGLTANLMRYWTVAVTDRNIVVCPFGLKGPATRLPRDPIEVLEERSRRWWFPVAIGGRRHYVAMDEFDIVAGANQWIRTVPGIAPSAAAVQEPVAVPPAAAPVPTTLPAAGWFPDPTGHHQLRYWDGGTWTPDIADDGAQGKDPITAG